MKIKEEGSKNAITYSIIHGLPTEALVATFTYRSLFVTIHLNIEGNIKIQQTCPNIVACDSMTKRYYILVYVFGHSIHPPLSSFNMDFIHWGRS